MTGKEKVEQIAEGFQFAEGPSWHDGALLFSDILGDAIYRWSSDAGVQVFRKPSSVANGLMRDREGRLLVAEHASRRVSRTLADGTVVNVADRFEGRRLNSPNDLVVAENGTVYFTDPPYGIGNEPGDLPFMGVFRVTPDGALSVEWRGPLSARPNGLVLSPGGRHLYVADSEAAHINRFDVKADGRLGPPTRFVSTAPVPDGMAIDEAGRLYVATSLGVEVFEDDGSKLGLIKTPQPVSNCTFGEADRRSLFITGRTAVYRVRLPTPGL